WTADVLMDTYAAESTVLRAQAALRAAARTAALQVTVAQVLISDTASRIEASARQALAAMMEGDTLRIGLAALRRLVKVTPINSVTLRREIATRVIETQGYPF